MAAINTLREKGGKIIVFLIGFSIIAFVGADLLGPNSTLLGGGKTDIGEISGTTITYKDFLAKQEEIVYNWQQSNGKPPSSDDMVSVRNITWDALVAELAFKNEYSSLGLAVSDEEIVDMVQGDNISAEIKQAFTDPETGEFSKDNVVTFLQELEEQTPAQRANWYNFERNLGPGRLRLKFDNLIIKTNYATEAEAKFNYKNESSTAEINFLYVPFLPIPDSSVQVSDSELNSYLSDNEREYQREETKSIKYVSFDIVPSAQDTAYVLEDIARLKEELIETENDSIYANVNSDGNDPYKNYTSGQIPAALQGDDVVLGEGAIVGPVVENEKYVVYKISSLAKGDSPSARASHILFKWVSDSDSDKAATKKEAKNILRKIKNGSDFAEMARLHSTDGTASKGGDLGWFTEEAMVAPFQEAVYAAKRKGVLSDVVETQFGYHIIDVTEVKTEVVYKIAKVELEIYVSDETRNNFYRMAENFALNTSNQNEFEENVSKDELVARSATNIRKNDRRVTGISDGRNIVYWAYNTASLGDVSEVFEINNQYVIAVLTEEQEKGNADLESVRVEVTKKVVDQKKAEVILSKLNGLSGNLDEIAAAYGDGASVRNMPALRLNSNTLTSVGSAPEAVGVAFSMENGETTKAFTVDNGVIIIEMVNKLDAPEISDYESYRTQVLQKRQGRMAYSVDRAVKDLAEIIDERYKFF